MIKRSALLFACNTRFLHKNTDSDGSCSRIESTIDMLTFLPILFTFLLSFASMSKAGQLDPTLCAPCLHNPDCPSDYWELPFYSAEYDAHRQAFYGSSNTGATIQMFHWENSPAYNIRLQVRYRGPPYSSFDSSSAIIRYTHPTSGDTEYYIVRDGLTCSINCELHDPSEFHYAHLSFAESSAHYSPSPDQK